MNAPIPQPIRIEPPSLRDLVPLRRLFVVALRQDFTYFPADYVTEINRQNNLLRLALAQRRRGRVMQVAKYDGQVIGYALGSLTPEGNGELYWLYVNPAARQRGIGNRLLEAGTGELLAKGARRVTLVTYNLKDYYLRHGFHHRGTQHIHGLDLDVMEYPADGRHD